MSEADIPVEMTNLGDVVKFRNSNNSMCTINTAHMLKCWGWWINNWRTQLDELGPVLDISLADNHFCVVLEDTSVRCFGNNDWGVNDVPDGLTDAAKVSVSNWTSCVVKTDGSTQCWGYNSQLPGDLQSAKAIFVNHRHGCILTISDTMQCWGSWNITRIPEALDEPVREITSNDAIMCANTDTKTVCWGDWADYGITYPHLTAIQGNGADAVCGLNETGHVDCQSVWGHRTEMIPVKFKAAPTFTASSGPSQPMIESITWDGNEVDVAFHPSTSTGNGTAITYYGLQDRGVDEYCGFGPDEFSGDGLFHCVFESDPNQAHNFLAIAYNDVGQQSGFLYATSPQDIPLSDKSTSIDVVTNDGEVDSTLVSLTPAVCQVGKASAAYVELTGDDGKRSKILLNSAGTCTLQASASGTQSVLRQFEVLSEQAGHGLDVDVFHWDRWAQQFDEDPSRLCATGQLPNLQYTDQDGIAPLNEDSCGTDHFSMHWKGFIKWPGEYDGVSTSNVKFNAVTDDGQKIIVDGVEVVGSAAGNEGSISDGVEHLSGSIVPFEFWLTEWEGGAYSNVYWNATHTDTDPQQEPRDLIPEAALMRNVSFARAQQTLSWTNQMLYAPTSYLGDYVPLSAQSTAGAVPITFSAAQGSDCTVNGDFAVLSVQNGTCVIEAHSPGDEVTEESNTISIQIHYTVGARSNLWVRNNPRIAHRYRVGDLLAGYDFLEGEIRDSQNRIVYGYYTFAPGNEYAERAGEHDVAGIFHPYNTLRYSEKAVWINYYVQPRDWYDVNEWPTLCDSAVAGMPYSTCELSGGSATVDGHFEYREPNRLFSEGGNYPSIDFVPDDVELEIHTWWWPYVQAQREMRTPVVSVWPTAGVIATGSALSTSVLVGGQADVDGQFQYENPGIVPDNSVTTQTVVFIPSDTYLYNSVTGSVTVSYGLDPEVTTARATDITYGQRLSNSTLSGISGTTPGTYRFASQNTQPDAGDHEFAAWYIPADTSVYYITQVMVPIHVNRATLSKTEDPSVAGLAPLLRLSEIWYSTTGWQSGQFGTYAWDNPNQQIQAGNHSYPITFTPSNINFLPMSLTVVRDVAKLNSTVSIAPLASSIFTSQTLGDSVLSGGLTNTPGTWAWYDPLTNHYGAGIVRPAIVFTPTDSNNYQPTTIEVNLEVLSEDSAIQAELGQTPVASAITYGQQVETSTLSGGSATAGGSSVAGEFVWAHPTTVLAPSNRTQQVTFTPTSARYLGFTLDVNITGIKRTPFVVHSPQAEGLQVGDSLSDSILTGGETDVEGVWEWLSEDNEVEAGSQTYLARFIPSDSETYSSVSQNIEVTVSKIQSEISLNPEIESELTYGVLLSDITVTGGLATTAGSFAWSDSTIKPEVGDSDQTLVFTPTEANKYLGFSVTVTITVGKAEPTVSGTVSVNPFSYGQALSTVNINGLTSSVPGAWSWAIPTDLPDITDTTAEAVFTPTDSTHYKTVVRQIAIVVNKAQLRLGVKPTPGVLGYGDSISAATVTGGTALLGTLAIPGTWVWQNGATKTVIGTSQQKLSFVPDDTDHFIGFTDVAVALVTGKGSPRVVTYPTVPLVKPGVKVSTVKFTGGKMNVPGKFAWATPTVVVKDNTRVQAFTFTPTDTKKYNSVRVSITLNLMTVPGSPTADPVTPVAYPKAKSTVFKWVAPASNGGSPITKYEYCLTTCTVAKNWKSTALKTTATVAGIPLGATGVVQVRATNAVGSSSPISIAYTQEK
jgi:hypothetical protein